MEKPSGDHDLANAKLERKPSLEEPLTLSHEELNSLREAALEVLNTHTKEEAEKIFMGVSKHVTITETSKASSKGKMLGKRSRRR